ncbi:Calmodulin-binding transcription activator 1 [Forsythia ovata]|uniref:Calmodulin-binding transcription activator 1 n=1 Tax=Forsythia ovata TaxID=205694 RepID=A0ABD1V021_9LAMI
MKCIFSMVWFFYFTIFSFAYLEQILQEAQHRWLRPLEICEILRNHQKFYLTPSPPVRPPAGSLFLFDRKVLRYFRKDGHNWRKKKDGKTVKEAHEKLKVGSVDALHCYYAHGEDNENFQRRSYWMLEEQLERIVLVHYRGVKEGHNLGLPHLLTAANPGPQLGSSQTSSASWFAQNNSPGLTVQESYTSSLTADDSNEQRLSSEFHDEDSGGNLGDSFVHSIHGCAPDYTLLSVDKETGCLELSRDNSSSELHEGSSIPGTSYVWADVHGSSKNLNMQNHKLNSDQKITADFLSRKLIDARLDADKVLQNVLHSRDGLSPDTSGVLQVVGDSSAAPERSVSVGALVSDETRELKKLDSFGRWMDKEIGGDFDDSLMGSDSGNYWNTLDTANDENEVSSLSGHMHLDTDSLGPSLSQDQLYSISDFAPDWACSGVETKVLISGFFLGERKLSDGHKWCCMFGEIEVPAEVLSDNVIRCQVPFHTPGRVPFYVTCSNRLACSEVREFEYRENPSGKALPLAVESREEARVQIRLVKMLCLGVERQWLDCSAALCDKCEVKTKICALISGNETPRRNSEEKIALIEADHVNLRDALIQNCLKDKLYEWLVCKKHGGGKGMQILNGEGQGVIHLTAALGYEWALGPITAAGISTNFRDRRGRTALHWASYFGREEAVVTLIRLGAAAGAVDDPTPDFPAGQTAADLASNRGHKGIAGYLAEADLTGRLLYLSVSEGSVDTLAATVSAEKALQTATQEVIPISWAKNEDISLKDSLVAVRKSAHAAALIQAAFRARSFRQRQLVTGSNNISEAPFNLVALGSLNKVQKMGHFQEYLHSAAIKIQQKYRGWKDRKKFLNIRSRIVKLQAHVRGHQVRKQYRKVVWSVSVVEKVILRWRRKKRGLRGFQTKTASEDAPSEVEKKDEYEYEHLTIGRKQKIVGVERALERVHSMVRHPEARNQYMRLVAKFENSKLNNEERS